MATAKDTSPAPNSVKGADKRAEEQNKVKVETPAGAPVVSEPSVVPKNEPGLADIGYGSLKPGETGVVDLDQNGKPVGEPRLANPEGEKGPVAAVHRPAEAIEQGVTTPAGAPITESMNPEPQGGLMDDRFLERNPPGGTHNSDAAIAADGPSKGQPEYYKDPREANSPDSHRGKNDPAAKK